MTIFQIPSYDNIFMDHKIIILEIAALETSCKEFSKESIDFI